MTIPKDKTKKYEDIDSWHELLDTDEYSIRVRLVVSGIDIFIKNIDAQAANGQTINKKSKAPAVYLMREIAITNKLYNNNEIKISSDFSYPTTLDTLILYTSPSTEVDKVLPRDLRNWVRSNSQNNETTMIEEYNKYLDTVEIHKCVDYMANLYFTADEDILIDYVENVLNYIKTKQNTIADIGNTMKKFLTKWVRMIDSIQGYNDKKILPNSTLEKISEIISNNKNIIGKNYIDQVFNQSLRLLLAKRLKELKMLKEQGGIHEFNPENDAVTKAFENDSSFSAQQKAIILSTEPLIIGAAGAGSGKSHTVIGRLSYLEQQGIDLSSVGVFSFTNIAADNISERYPNIHSETLANMFNEIYQMNYPLQVLSQPTTVSNSIKILDENDPIFANYPDKDALNEFIHK